MCCSSMWVDVVSDKSDSRRSPFRDLRANLRDPPGSARALAVAALDAKAARLLC